ncbi:MAG: lipoate--protein ligase family protein [Candidatus Aminicenantales bacterium]
MKMWHLLVDDIPLKGSLNMAIDEFLFNSLTDEPQTCVRFYRWERPTISIGYSQNVTQAVNLDFCRSHGIDVVRRITGGKLVLHHQEVTYSICSSDTGIFTQTLKDSYRLISLALMRGLEKMGLQPVLAAETPSDYVRKSLLCFSHPAQNEVEVGGKKIVGSAQKRMGSRFLQHGSIPMAYEKELLESVSIQKKKEPVRITSLNESLGQKVDFTWAVRNLTDGISEYFGISFSPKVFNDREMGVIHRIQVEKYARTAWTFGPERVQSPEEPLG